MQIGVDEVGRGCLAGPLVVGAVGLMAHIDGLKDSKELSALARERLAKEIYSQSAAASLGWVWPHEIDSMGLSAATTLAIKRALSLINIHISSILIDGNFNYLASNRLVKTMVKADSLVPAVSAASIIAKVARDNYMKQISSYFPPYNFATHVGYGTAQHLAAIVDHGPCVLHRLSFRPLAKESFSTF